MLRNPLFLISIFLIFFNTSSFAEKTHGIAMHGKPKYEEGFTHLDYVNPDAPKGGTVRFGAYGCLLYTSPSPRDLSTSRMPSSA